MTQTYSANVDLSKILSYEEGTLSDDATLVLFQQLVDSGLAWRLQGHYGRTANDLIEQGKINPPQIKSCKEDHNA